MSSPIHEIEYTSVEGGKKPADLSVIALSTCAFCKRAMQFLKDNDVAFRYVYLDQLDFDFKREVKLALKEKYGDIKVYPILLVDDKEAVTGFVKEKWAEKVGVPAE